MMTEADASRLKWCIIEAVSEFFESHNSEAAADLIESFTRQYDALLQQNDTDDIDEISKFHHLIQEFKPAISSVVQPGEDFDRLLGLVSPILNSAISKAEHKKMKSSLRAQESTRPLTGLKSPLYPLYDSSKNLELMSVGIDIGSSTTH
ncbi:MAG: hypothetical protein ACTSV2_07585, partial [Candidatus Thorarchaeota archaeon]